MDFLYDFFHKLETQEFESPTGEKQTKSFVKLRKGRISVCIFLILIILSGTIMLPLSACEVPSGHTGVVTSFGRVEDYVFSEGLNFKAPWKKVIKINNRVQKQEISLKAFSSDTQEVSIIYAFSYQPEQSSIMNIYKNYGVDYYEIIIAPMVNEAIKEHVGQYDAEKLVKGRNKLAIDIENQFSKAAKKYNIIISETAIVDLDFTDKYTDAVEAKQVAQQKKLEAEIKAEQDIIEAEAKAEVKRIEAQAAADAKKIAAKAEAEANKKIGNSLNENVLKNKWYEKWDGKYPQVVSDGGTIIDFPMSDK